MTKCTAVLLGLEWSTMCEFMESLRPSTGSESTHDMSLMRCFEFAVPTDDGDENTISLHGWDPNPRYDPMIQTIIEKNNVACAVLCCDVTRVHAVKNLFKRFTPQLTHLYNEGLIIRLVWVIPNEDAAHRNPVYLSNQQTIRGDLASILKIDCTTPEQPESLDFAEVASVLPGIKEYYCQAHPNAIQNSVNCVPFVRVFSFSAMEQTRLLEDMPLPLPQQAAQSNLKSAQTPPFLLEFIVSAVLLLAFSLLSFSIAYDWLILPRHVFSRFIPDIVLLGVAALGWILSFVGTLYTGRNVFSKRESTDTDLAQWDTPLLKNHLSIQQNMNASDYRSYDASRSEQQSDTKQFIASPVL